MAFAVLEIVCFAGFVLCLFRGRTMVASAFLVGPLQLAALFVLSRDYSWLLFYLVAVMPFTALGLLPYPYVHFIHYPGIFGLLLLLALTEAVVPASGSPRGRLARTERIPLTVLAVLAVVSTTYATLRHYPTVPVMEFLPVLYFLAAVWFFATVPRSFGQVRRLILAMAVVSGVVAATLPMLTSGIRGGLMGKSLVTPFSTVNLNALAVHFAVFSAVATAMVLDARRLAGKLVLAGLAVLLLGALLFTKSRGAWLGFGIAFLYILVRTRSLWALVAAAGAGALLFTQESLLVNLTVRFEATGASDPSLWGRVVLWKYAWDVFRDNWLIGVGMHNYRLVKFLYGFPWPRVLGLPYNSHNLFLEFLVDLGVVGLVSFLWLEFRAFFRVDRLARGPRDVRFLAVGLNAGLLAFGVHGLLDCVIWHHSAFLLLGVMLGLAFSLNRLSDEAGVLHAAGAGRATATPETVRSSRSP